MPALRNAAAALLCLASASAGATQVIDTTGDWTGDQATGWWGTAQTFTVPALDRVLESWSFDQPGADAAGYSFSIRALVGGLPTGATLWSTSVTGAAASGHQQFDAIDLALNAGQQYAAVIVYQGQLGLDLNFTGDSYAGGSSFWSEDPTDPTRWTALPALDHSFRAVFGPASPAPEADSAAMLLAGGGLLAAVLRRRNRRHAG
ncbi:hypothetical protein [Derxia lacustris]|uniref:hypothetical protein n=1 Tax=Derxia lacustris TaxID=764842 RepID=UPI000A1735E5|nr:hypothetical protein [Derxia lacustris]